MPPLLLLYDGSCPICRLLASLVEADAPQHWEFIAWQKFPDPQLGPPSMQINPHHPSELALRDGMVWLEGEAAWQLLIEREPHLIAFQNLAARVGLAEPLNARWLRRLAHGLRRLCFACRPSLSVRKRRQEASVP